MQKSRRNENLRRYHREHPEITQANLAKIFKISQPRVTQILSGQRELLDDTTSTHRGGYLRRQGNDIY